MWKIVSQGHILSTAGDALNSVHKTWNFFKFWAKPLGGGQFPKEGGHDIMVSLVTGPADRAVLGNNSG
jgi:hypothetical protein